MRPHARLNGGIRKRSARMALTDIIFVAGVALIFCVLAGTLAWAERRTRTRFKD